MLKNEYQYLVGRKANIEHAATHPNSSLSHPQSQSPPLHPTQNINQCSMLKKKKNNFILPFFRIPIYAHGRVKLKF